MSHIIPRYASHLKGKRVEFTLVDQSYHYTNAHWHQFSWVPAHHSHLDTRSVCNGSKGVEAKLDRHMLSVPDTKWSTIANSKSIPSMKQVWMMTRVIGDAGGEDRTRVSMIN